MNVVINRGLVASVEFGKGWEYGYGFGAEWAPFKKFFYLTANAQYINQILNDNSPNHNVFVSIPDKIEMTSNFNRFSFGAKVLTNWWDKKDDKNSYLIMSYVFITDYLIK